MLIKKGPRLSFIEEGLSLRSRYENATPNLCCKGSFFEIAFSSSTHFCLALRHLVTFCLTLTNYRTW